MLFTESMKTLKLETLKLTHMYQLLPKLTPSRVISVLKSRNPIPGTAFYLKEAFGNLETLILVSLLALH